MKESAESLTVYTPEELAERDGQTRPEIWVAFEGRIYDVTRSKLFKNGKHFRHASGQDLTQEMDRAPHTDRVFEGFEVVGVLASEEIN